MDSAPPKDSLDPRHLRPVEPVRYDFNQEPVTASPDPHNLPVESPITINVENAGLFTIMASPADLRALAAGFILSEGLIDSREDIKSIGRSVEEPDTVLIKLARRPENTEPGRNLIVASSCGLCGVENLDSILAGLPTLDRTLSLSPLVLREVRWAMEKRQLLFQETGGSHAAAIFSSTGEILSMAEDVGRHNALDKAIGRALLEGIDIAGTGAALSGRVSLELAIKAARAGIEVISAVSAPTSLALEVAQRTGLTLCGFVRSQRATVYTHPERVRP